MIGFNLSIGEFQFEETIEKPNKIVNYLKDSGFCASRSSLKRFLDDKLFYNDSNYFLLMEGVVLNKDKFCKGESWEHSIIQLYFNEGENFFRKFRGSFAGVFYDKKNDKFIIFSDHVGSKHIYYYHQNDELYVSTSMEDMYSFLRKNAIKYSLSERASYMLLTYGYMLGNATLCRQINRLTSGNYIVFEKRKFVQKSFFDLPTSYVHVSEDEAIEKIDDLFRRAIELQFNKDREYGYKHFVALSGGLDSRMTSWVANKMGYENQLNYTFSQTNYLDETIAKTISGDLGHEWIFKALDNGNFLTNIDEVNTITGGNTVFYGVSHGLDMLSHLNFEKLGLLHSGQLGDVIIGSYLKTQNIKHIYRGEGMHSRKLMEELNETFIEFNSYNEHESYIFKQRGLNGILTGNLGAQQFTETISPFCDPDFISYCLSIPIELRLNHNIYVKWILKKYPQSAGYIWENTGEVIKDNRIKIRGKEVTLKKLYRFVGSNLGFFSPRINTKEHMNPFDYWLRTNHNLRKFQDNYFEKNIEFLARNKKLQNHCDLLYKNGNAIEKSQVLTLLSSLKLFFDK